MTDITTLGAVDLVRLIRAGQLSSREVVSAFLTHIDAVNPGVNAVVTRVPERAIEAARRADEQLARREPVGSLHGLPIAHKDLQPTAGIRTTFGSPIFRDYVPTEDSPLVRQLRRAGAITIGKTNTPEFGAGSQTFNPVFGATLNPYDTTKTCGGSSGGAAVALACGMLPLADGTDMGGSLRNPAAFCGVVGMRPSPSMIPWSDLSSGWSCLSVDGPMARTVPDLALLLAALAGVDPPFRSDTPGASPVDLLPRTFNGVRVAWFAGLGGVPFDRQILEVVDRQRRTFESFGCVVEQAEPDLSAADDIFRTLRAKAFVQKHGATVRAHRDLVKPAVIDEVERCERLSDADVAAAEAARDSLRRQVARFMERYEFFILPTTQVPPFDVNTPYVTEINGTTLRSYIDWMKSCYYISAIGHPAISVPCGFTPERLPVGLQIVGRDRADWQVVQIARAYEQARGALAPFTEPIRTVASPESRHP